MRVEKPVNSLCTFAVFDAVDLVTDHQTRYYAVPKDYRCADNPQDNDPAYCYTHFINDMGTPESRAYLEALNLMSDMYWKLLADDAEATYKAVSGQ